METIQALLQQGVQSHTQGDFQGAVIAYQQALDLDPENAVLHNNLGFLYGQLQNWEQSLHHLQRAIDINDHLAIAYANLGQVQAATKQGAEAVKNLQQAITLEPDNTDHWHQFARVYFAAQDYPNAEYAWYRALNLAPDNVEYLLGLATTMVGQQRYSEAYPVFDHIFQLQPDYQPAWAQKGVALFLQQNYGAAKQCLLKALDLNNSDYVALKHLALTYIACKENEQALVIMDQLHVVFPQDSAIECDLAVLELSVGRKQQAKDRLQQLAVTQEDSRILYYLAVSLKECGENQSQSEVLFNKIIARRDEYSAKAKMYKQFLNIH